MSLMFVAGVGWYSFCSSINDRDHGSFTAGMYATHCSYRVLVWQCCQSLGMYPSQFFFFFLAGLAWLLLGSVVTDFIHAEKKPENI